MAVNVENPHLTKLPVDYLYHLNIDNETTNLKEKFGDVKFVVMGGAVARMSSFAQTLYDTLKGKLQRNKRFSVILTGKLNRRILE